MAKYEVFYFREHLARFIDLLNKDYDLVLISLTTQSGTYVAVVKGYNLSFEQLRKAGKDFLL